MILRVHMGPYGPGRALEEREKFKKNTFSLSSIFSQKTVVFNFLTTFFNGKTVFFRFLAEIRLRTLIKSSQKQVLDPNRAISIPPAPCLKLQSERSDDGLARVFSLYFFLSFI